MLQLPNFISEFIFFYSLLNLFIDIVVLLLGPLNLILLLALLLKYDFFDDVSFPYKIVFLSYVLYIFFTFDVEFELNYLFNIGFNSYG
jgi:hypothetical protein